METVIILSGDKVTLRSCTNEYWHEFYKNYVIDPMMDSTPYVYDYDRIEKAYYTKTTDATRLYFVIIHQTNVIGQIYLKHIDNIKKSVEFGIALVNDSVKGKGYGTEAINLLINYTFNTLNMDKIFADSVLRNTKSQHILEKIGFIYTHEDSVFKYYILEKNQWVR